MMRKELTIKQKAFCDYYIEFGNATEAAKELDTVKKRHLESGKKTYINLRYRNIYTLAWIK